MAAGATSHHPYRKIYTMFAKLRRGISFICLLFAFSAFAFSGQLAPAHAQSRDTGFSLVNLIAEAPTTTIYGGTTSGFQVTFNHPNPIPGPNTLNDVVLCIDVSVACSGPSSSTIVSPTEKLDEFTGFRNLSFGTHQVQVRYFIISTATTIYSNTVTITIGQAYATTTCLIHNLAYAYAPGSNITVDFNMLTTGSQPVDWQNGTFTINFTGPSTVSYPKQKANSNEQVTVKVPTTPGQYALVCNFDGSPFFHASQGEQLAALVSQGHKTGAIRVYTNPTTIHANQSNTWYVVIPAGDGLPTPTGSFGITIGNSSTRPITLSSSGDATVQLTAPTSVYGNITILYFGDGVYSSETATFPLTNPPIPGAGGGAATPGPTTTAGGTATPGTPAPTVTGGTTGTPAATPAGTPVAGAASAKTDGPTGPGATPIVGGTLGLLAIAGGGMLLWRRRLGTVAATPAEHIWRQEPMMDDTAKLPTPRADWGD